MNKDNTQAILEYARLCHGIMGRILNEPEVLEVAPAPSKRTPTVITPAPKRTAPAAKTPPKAPVVADPMAAVAPKAKPKTSKKSTTKRVFNVDRAVETYAEFEPSETGCYCGCGETPAANKVFIRGHQHFLNSIVKAVQLDKLPFNKIAPQAYAHVAANESYTSDVRDRCKEALPEPKQTELAV